MEDVGGESSGLGLGLSLSWDCCRWRDGGWGLGGLGVRKLGWNGLVVFGLS